MDNLLIDNGKSYSERDNQLSYLPALAVYYGARLGAMTLMVGGLCLGAEVSGLGEHVRSLSEATRQTIGIASMLTLAVTVQLASVPIGRKALEVVEGMMKPPAQGLESLIE